MLTLSIVIPTYNGRRHLERCLPAVCRYAPRRTQIIIVDDASNDDSGAWVRRHFPSIELVELPTNQGFVAAANAGIRAARGDIVELLNNDTEVTAGWAHPCLRRFTDPKVGSVAPLVLRMDRPTVIDSAGMEYHACGWAYNRGFNRNLSTDYESVKEVFKALPHRSSWFLIGESAPWKMRAASDRNSKRSSKTRTSHFACAGRGIAVSSSHRHASCIKYQPAVRRKKRAGGPAGCAQRRTGLLDEYAALQISAQPGAAAGVSQHPPLA